MKPFQKLDRMQIGAGEPTCLALTCAAHFVERHEITRVELPCFSDLMVELAYPRWMLGA